MTYLYSKIAPIDVITQEEISTLMYGSSYLEQFHQVILKKEVSGEEVFSMERGVLTY